MATSDAPVEIGRVALTTRDLPGAVAFYRDMIGLEPLTADAEVAQLGIGGHALVELRADRAAKLADPRDAGLFHTAFLLPDRAALGAWLLHAAQHGQRLEGASDHGVSEALYLRDPEGNGIEIYVDRPRDLWPIGKDGLEMFTRRLNLDELASNALTQWNGAPLGSVVGHVHLQVGDLDRAEDFITNGLGLDVMQRGQGARFFGSGGYHHHLAGNIWNSAGARPRPEGRTGLAGIELLVAPGQKLENSAGLIDPWGTKFSFTAKGL